MVQPYYTVEAPDAAMARGGLLNAVTPDESAGDRVGAGVQHMSSVACGTASPAPGVCNDALELEENESGLQKEFDGIDWENALPFGIYKGIVCDMSQDYTQLATEGLLRGEGVAVEEAFQSLILNKAGTEVLGGGAKSVVEAVALLEQHAAEVYGALPMLHASRYGATHLGAEDVVKADSNWMLHTIQGTPTVNGGGYTETGPGAVGATAGQFWLYATGAVHIWRSGVIASESTDTAKGGNYALAERLYAVTRECFTAAVLVDTTA